MTDQSHYLKNEVTVLDEDAELKRFVSHIIKFARRAKSHLDLQFEISQLSSETKCRFEDHKLLAIGQLNNAIRYAYDYPAS